MRDWFAAQHLDRLLLAAVCVPRCPIGVGMVIRGRVDWTTLAARIVVADMVSAYLIAALDGQFA